MCFVWIWEQTATCATYSINWLVFITEMKSFYSAVRTGSLNQTNTASSQMLHLHTVYYSRTLHWLHSAMLYWTFLKILTFNERYYDFTFHQQYIRKLYNIWKLVNTLKFVHFKQFTKIERIKVWNAKSKWILKLYVGGPVTIIHFQCFITMHSCL